MLGWLEKVVVVGALTGEQGKRVSRGFDGRFDDQLLMRTRGTKQARGRNRVLVLDNGFDDLVTGRWGVINDGFDEATTGLCGVIDNRLDVRRLGTTFFFLILTRA